MIGLNAPEVEDIMAVLVLTCITNIGWIGIITSAGMGLITVRLLKYAGYAGFAWAGYWIVCTIGLAITMWVIWNAE